MTNQDYWDNRYAENSTVWDLGEVSPPLKAYFDQVTNKQLRILIPGCGNGYEAEYLLQQSFDNVTVIDIAPLAVAQMQKRFANYQGINIISGDFFELKAEYDLIVEQTFFCAIDPSLRPKYVQKMYELLAPKGKLVGLLFDIQFEKEGPPFGGSKEEFIRLFSEKFQFNIFEDAYNSVKPRSGSEVFINFGKK